MPSASLIPDRQLTFSPELAETIGLEEAVLLQALASHLSNTDDWAPVSLKALQATLSFWSPDHIATLPTKLVALGIVNQKVSQDPNVLLLSGVGDIAGGAQGAPRSGGASSKPGVQGWQPSEALLELLVLNHGIPRSFVDSARSAFFPSEGSEADTQFRQ